MKYLTKSKFKMALECPTKLFYNEHKEIYANAKLDDPFLAALAKGGFQVGELAKCYYPEGHDIEDLDYDKSLLKTSKLLKKNNVIIFEAAVKYQKLFIRVDILEKKGNTLNLIEVKSKSVNPESFDKELWNSKDLKKGIHFLKRNWKSYLYDIAFQSFVLKKAFPNYKVNNFLMCTDKSVKASVDGLNQKFLLVENNDRVKAVVNGDVSPQALGEQILYKIPVDEIIEIIHSDREMSVRFDDKTFSEMIEHFSKALNTDTKLTDSVGIKCKKCEFRTYQKEKQSGFNECWQQQCGFSPEELKKPFAFDIWNYRGAQKAIDDGRPLMEDLCLEDFKSNPKKNGCGLANGERQIIQFEKVKNEDYSPYFDKEGLLQEMNTWQYPLHMIDFETCMAAIPFNKGHRPYEQIAFQFSHHIIYENGKIEHANEYINTKPGFYPNFEFVRELKKSLGNTGSIFRYANHENTVLCQIREQILESEIIDKKELVSFIESITHKTEKGSQAEKKFLWKGKRDMIDLCEMVKRYYYSPHTRGSNSIKYVLPAILKESKFLQSKYSQPIYGKNENIKSKNFNAHIWISLNKDGQVINPYHTLPPIFDKWDYEELELVMSDSEIADGGAALTAYAMMQFTHMSDREREKIQSALLRYCELDTLAMVMIWQHWNDLIKIK
ncbi:MAG: DUF2779 domain-containing protein [Halobacteriovoraceae bacterium]|nr:DUF2779 domain-containing protein [Halobacteriovoraceae bacterium]